MPRARVLSFMTQWGGGAPKSPQTSTPGSPSAFNKPESPNPASTPTLEDGRFDGATRSNGTPQRASRPPSINSPQAYPAMDPASLDTPPELQPIFSYLSSHSNKLYQEGYFLKLHDLDSRGRPSADRIWNECFAQLVGTVLSLWDAAQLDVAGEEGEVVPTFINLTDASIRMIESLPMNGVQGQSLQNVLSVSTAANNRYLLHFNSLHSLTQWTAGIRLAMYEHSTLQEAYTGSLIAGKGKYLNNIRSIMERARFPTEDWARVRFGAGTPWRRCWCVITPPGDKDIAKAQKSIKKKSAYDQSGPNLKGDIKFYETRKITKKTKPLATITDAFSAYAIYPQAKPLIEQSTLVKIEGLITIHSTPPSTTEGFVFVMPEVHPAVTGFEMMLRFLLPVFDTFALYGRPKRLVADVLDPRSLMFAMPTQRRYGYLELIDVAGLIHTEGSPSWSENEWRKQMKNLTSKRISTQSANADRMGTGATRRNVSRSSLNLPGVASRSSSHLPSTRNIVRFGDGGTIRSQPSSRRGSPAPPQDAGEFRPIPRTDSAPALASNLGPRHQRAASDANTAAYGRLHEPSRLSTEMPNNMDTAAPPPPLHAGPPRPAFALPDDEDVSDREGFNDHERISSPMNGIEPALRPQPFQPVQAPPLMAHKPSAPPPVRPMQMPEVRMATGAPMDEATMQQLAYANNTPRLEQGVNGMSMSGQHMNGPIMNGRQMNGPPMNGPPMNGQPMNGQPMNGQPMAGHIMSGQQFNGPPMNGLPMSGAANNGPSLGGMLHPVQRASPVPQLTPPRQRSPQPPVMQQQTFQQPPQPWGTGNVRTLPTIPGTPSAVLEGRFDLPEMLTREQNGGNVARKAVGSTPRRSFEDQERF